MHWHSGVSFESYMFSFLFFSCFHVHKKTKASRRTRFRIQVGHSPRHISCSISLAKEAMWSATVLQNWYMTHSKIWKPRGWVERIMKGVYHCEKNPVLLPKLVNSSFASPSKITDLYPNCHANISSSFAAMISPLLGSISPWNFCVLAAKKLPWTEMGKDKGSMLKFPVPAFGIGRSEEFVLRGDCEC